MKSIVLTATIALFAAHVYAQSPSTEKENRGTAVSAVTTEKQDNHGQAVKAAAVNSRPEKEKGKTDKPVKDKAEETAKVEKAAKTEKAVKDDRLKDDKTVEKPDNHGQEVKAVAQRSDLSGQEKGQAVKAVASGKSESSNAAPERVEKPAKAERPAKADKPVKADKPAHEAKNKPAHQNHRAAHPHHGGIKAGPKGR